jgi:5-methylcytosine-specific restriction endonuclease McrA
LTLEEAGEQPGPVATLPGARPEQRGGGTMGRVLVLNASYEPINVCTVRRAAVLVLKQRAEILEHSQWALHAESLTLPRPVVIRLITYVRIPRDAHSRKITRRAIFARDQWRCQYCGGGGHGSLTVDHVIPRSRGGQTTWTNVVAACLRCNLLKGNRTLEEARLRLVREPVHPQFLFSMHLLRHPHATSFLDSWRKYLVAVPSMS